MLGDLKNYSKYFLSNSDNNNDADNDKIRKLVEFPNGFLDKKDERQDYEIKKALLHNSKKINKNKIIYKEKEESEESEITELNILKKEEKEESTSEKPQNKIENDDAISNILQKNSN